MPAFELPVIKDESRKQGFFMTETDFNHGPVAGGQNSERFANNEFLIKKTSPLKT
jgi:hypothetical protein